ncbi:terpenoid synthase [Trametopsis cervina]|nr:terpenoid synthase [Trametopsis cervina]
MSTFTLPNLLAMCPWKGSTNPNYEKAARESSAWVDSYNFFVDRKRTAFLTGSNELLVSHAYPYADYYQFRTVCDFINLLFVVDEVSDEQTGKEARKTGETFLNSLRHPECNDESPLARMTKEFRNRLMKHIGPASFRRFVAHCDSYIDAVAVEAELRERGEVLGVASFQELRRENSAIRICFDLMELGLGIDLPDAVFEDMTFASLYWAAVDLVCWSNDVYSYNMEQSKGIGGNNIVTVIMQENHVDLQAACDLVGDRCKTLIERFTAVEKDLPSELDTTAVAAFVGAMKDWVVGNLLWSFESTRYFGPQHAEVRRTLVVTLRPQAFE